jgi:acetylornithine/succinyldiaminopimelate/putrescine aminotransferase
MILFACALVTAAAFYYIFHIPDTMVAGAEKTRVAYLHERKEVVYDNFRDLNFEYKAGKVPEADYRTMKDSLEEEAAAILAEISQLDSGVSPAKPGLYKKGQRV